MSDRLTLDRLAELRQIAEAATPGPWEVVGLDGYGGPYALRMPHRSGRTWYGVEGIKRREDAEYFVAMNRNTVLALLDEIERLREQLRLATVDQAIAEAEASDAHAENKRLRDAVQQWRPTKTQSVSFWCPTCNSYQQRSRIDGKCPFCRPAQGTGGEQ